MSSSAPPLRPMTAGDILDQAIRIYRRNFVPLVTIVAIISVPLVLIQVAAAVISFGVTGTFTTTQYLGDVSTVSALFVGATGLSYLLGLIGAIFQNGALTAFVSERFLDRQITIGQAYQRALRRWLSLLIAAFLVGVALFSLLMLAFSVFFIPMIGIGASSAAGADNTTSGILGLFTLCFCVLIIPAFLLVIFFATRWVFYIQAIVLENYNSTGGLGRSWKLVRGTFWRVLGITALLYIMVAILSVAPTYAVLPLSLLLPSPILAAVLNTIMQSVVVILVTPLQFAALTVLYYDLRIRKEGFDLEQQLKQDAEPPVGNPPLAFGASV